jgi:RNA polymerase sigma-70 factor (ECF subfamily)
LPFAIENLLPAWFDKGKNGIMFAKFQSKIHRMFLRINFRFKKENDTQSLSDEDLIQSYKANQNNIYLSELFERYTHLVFGVCMKYLKNKEESKDAVMEIFENLMKALHNHEIVNFKSWIYSVSKNHCLMILRKSKSSERIKLNYMENIQPDIMELHDYFHLHDESEIKDKISQLQIAIEKLNEKQRRCIELLYLQDKSYEEVSVITGYSLNQVKSYIQNGKRNLKNYLGTE